MRTLMMAAALAAVWSTTGCKKVGEGEYEVKKPALGTTTDTVNTPSVETGTTKDTITVPTVRNREEGSGRSQGEGQVAQRSQSVSAVRRAPGRRLYSADRWHRPPGWHPFSPPQHRMLSMLKPIARRRPAWLPSRRSRLPPGPGRGRGGRHPGGAAGGRGKGPGPSRPARHDPGRADRVGAARLGTGAGAAPGSSTSRGPPFCPASSTAIPT